MERQKSPIVKNSLRDDELNVAISLAVAFGMLIGAVAAMWLWNMLSESVEAVMSLRSIEMP